MKTSWTQRLKYSPLSRAATLPMRLRVAAVPLLRQARLASRWLLQSREWATFSYDHEPEGIDAFVSLVSDLSGRDAADVSAFVAELLHDDVFAARYRQRVADTRLRYICDPELHHGRCLLNYVLVRAAAARVVFEAGTERGLSSWAMCRALRRNGIEHPMLVTVDTQADRGDFLDGDEGGIVRRIHGDSVAALRAIDEPIDFFLHDTVNEARHTRAQFAALEGRLAPGALIQPSWFGREFVEFCRSHRLRHFEYVERVRNHWYPGRRIGLATWPRAPAAGPGPHTGCQQT